MVYKNQEGVFYLTNLQRNTISDIQSFDSHDSVYWDGYICPESSPENCSEYNVIPLSPGQYQIQFSALKHFGNSSDPSDYDVYRSPKFNLVY